MSRHRRSWTSTIRRLLCAVVTLTGVTLNAASAPGGGERAPRAQVDALKLLAVFVQHSDTKPEQQGLVCAPGE
jgi:hypothetical protein